MSTWRNVGLVLALGVLALPGRAIAQSEVPAAAPTPTPETTTPVSTANTISLTGLTIPSLWWAEEQFSARQKFGSQLINTWAAYGGKPNQLGQIDFFVNRQLWSQLDYVERYTFIHEFGTVANSYGYNVRVFNERQEFLAAYTCDVSTPSAQAPVCNATLDSSGKAGFRGRSTNPLAPLAP